MYSIVITTAADHAGAKKITEALVQAKLAACVQFQSIESFYFWEGKVCNDPEILMLIKSKTSDYDQVEKTIKKNHSYDTPEIIRVNIDGGSKEYLSWISEVTR